MPYAKDTKVSESRSREEIERTLQRYGADQFMYGWDAQTAILRFRVNNRHVEFKTEMPSRSDPEYTKTPTGKTRTQTAAIAEWEKACRQRWRALALVIKAKLESVESGIEVFEEAFMPQILLPTGGSVGAFMMPQIERAYETSQMPSLLPCLEDE